jgi:hypothetical protein
MRMPVLVFAALLAAGPALAEAPAAPAPVPAHAPYTLDTPIEVLMEDPVTLAWLDAHFPGLSERMTDPEVGTLFAGVSIQGLSIDPDHGRALTPEVMAKLAVSLAKAQSEPAAAKPAT